MADKKEEPPCACNWKRCSKYRDTICGLAPGHVWAAAPIRLQLVPGKGGELTLAGKARLRAILRYFKPGNPPDASPLKTVTLNIYPHHFSRSLLLWKLESSGEKKFSTLLSVEQIKAMSDVDDGKTRLMQYTNSVGFLCGKDLHSPDIDRHVLIKRDRGFYRRLFPQTPMESKDAVESFVTYLEKPGQPSSYATRILKDMGTTGCTPVCDRVLPVDACTSVVEKKGLEGEIVKNGESHSISPQAVDVAEEQIEEEGDAGEYVAPDGDVEEESCGGDSSASASPSDPPVLSVAHRSHSPCRWDDHGGSTASSGPKQNPIDVTSLFAPLETCYEAMREMYARFYMADTKNLDVLLNKATMSDANNRQETWDTIAKSFQTSLHSESILVLSHLIISCHGNAQPFPLADKIHFCPCSYFVGRHTLSSEDQEPPCQGFTLRARRWGNREVLCRVCRKIKRHGERKERNKRKRSQSPPPLPGEAEPRYSPLTSMTHEDLQESLVKRTRENRNLKRRVNRYLTKIKNMQKSKTIIVRADTDVHDVMTQACNFVKKNLESSKAELMRAFMDIQFEEEGIGKDDSRREECVDHILSSVTNMLKTLQGKESQCRYSPHVMSTALCLFLRNRRAYEVLRESGVLCLPSPRKLSETGSELKSREGGDPLIYIALEEELSRRPDPAEPIIGHLMMDEIKLRNGVAYNSNSSEVVGFVQENFNLDDLYKKILVLPTGEESDDADTDNDKDSVLSVYANQWRYRSTRGIVHNGDFFFNTGSLDGNEILRQFFRVVSSYEYIGCKVLGLVCDAGGGNASFLRTIRKQEKVQGPWPSVSCVSFKNPVDSERNIYVWTCATHGLKALRNALYKSQKSQARDFIYDGLMFGWLHIVECFDRDEARRAQPDKKGRSDLVRHAVFLDRYTVMNCSYAKQPFSERTICEMIAHASSLLGVDIPLGTPHESQWHKFHSAVSILKDACSDGGKKVAPETATLVCTLQYQVAVYGIFIERFLNAKWKLTKKNIAHEKKVLEESLNFFTDWHAEREEMYEIYCAPKKRQKKKTSELQEGVELTQSQEVPEGSQSKSQSQDEVLLTAEVLNPEDFDLFWDDHVTEDTVSRDNQPSVSTSLNVNADTSKTPTVMTSTKTEIAKHYLADQTLENLLITVSGFMAYAQGVLDCDPNEDAFVPGLHSNQSSIESLFSRIRQMGKAFGYLLGDMFKTLEITASRSFQRLCTDEGSFCDFLHLSRRNGHYTWFVELLDKENSEDVTQLCQVMVESIFHLVEQTLESRSKERSSIECSFLTFLQAGGLQKITEPYKGKRKVDERQDVCFFILFELLKGLFFRQWLPEATAKYRQEARSKSKRLMEPQSAPSAKACHRLNNDNVNRFGGWALSSLICTYRDKLSRTMNGENPGCRMRGKTKKKRMCRTSPVYLSEVLAVLGDMKVLQNQILGNREYMRLFYPVDDAIRDKGRLTLISPKYIYQMSCITSFIDEKVGLHVLKSHAFGGGLKKEILSSMQQEGDCWKALDEIVEISLMRVPTDQAKITREQRKVILLELVDKLLNAHINALTRQYRSEKLTRKNDFKFREGLKVLCGKSREKSECKSEG